MKVIVSAGGGGGVVNLRSQIKFKNTRHQLLALCKGNALSAKFSIKILTFYNPNDSNALVNVICCWNGNTRITYINKCEALVTTGASAIHRSIDQSIKEKTPSQSINQPIHYLLLIFIDSSNQSINQLISPMTFKISNQSINWPPFQDQFSLWIVEISRFRWFFTPFWIMKKLMRPWDGGGDAEEGSETEPGDQDWLFLWGFDFLINSAWNDSRFCHS